MSESLDINKTFSKPSVTDWVEKTHTDLKGAKTAAELQYLIEEGLSVDAVQAYTGSESRPAIQRPKDSQAIVAAHLDTRSGNANKLLLDMLNVGLTTIILNIYPETNYDQVLDGVILDYIEIVLHTDNGATLDKALTHLQSVSMDMNRVYHPNHHRRLIHVSLQESITDQVANTIAQVSSSDAKEILLIVDGQTDFLSEVAKHRAIHILIANVEKALDKTITYKLVSHPKARQTEVHELIQSSYMALSAMIGQADGLVAVVNDSKYQLNAIHISNLMSMESHIDKVNDPAAGSDLIEEMTDEICKVSWKKFKAGMSE